MKDYQARALALVAFPGTPKKPLLVVAGLAESPRMSTQTVRPVSTAPLISMPSPVPEVFALLAPGAKLRPHADARLVGPLSDRALLMARESFVQESPCAPLREVSPAPEAFLDPEVALPTSAARSSGTDPALLFSGLCERIASFGAVSAQKSIIGALVLQELAKYAIAGYFLLVFLGID